MIDFTDILEDPLEDTALIETRKIIAVYRQGRKDALEEYINKIKSRLSDAVNPDDIQSVMNILYDTLREM